MAVKPAEEDDERPASLSEPLLPADETPGKPIRLRRRPSLKRNWKRVVFAIFVLIVFIALILGFRGKGKDPTLQIPDTPLLVTLPGYGTFRGVWVNKSSKNKQGVFQEPIDAWLGVDYSIQPVNQSRFASPDWPIAFNGTKDASDYGKVCMQNGGFDPNHHSEACLSLNLYRPKSVPLETKLPIFVFLHGGAFVLGSGRSFDGATFIARSKEPLMVVTVQYRLGALGSLPSKLFEDEGLLNLGIQDQRMALEFLQKYVTHFGGDPARVTLGGQSAGAHSVGIHQFHAYNGDERKRLFSQAILASGAPTARSFAPATYALYKRQYQQFLDYMGCSDWIRNAEILACIRRAPLGVIRKASGKVYGDFNYNITWPWQPVSPGPLLETLGSISGINGTFYKIPTLISSTTDEGKFFAPKDLRTNADFTRFMSNLLPGLTNDDIAELSDLYSDPSDGDGPYTDSAFSSQWERISAAYGDYSYICPVQETAHRLGKAGAPVYKARFNTAGGGNMGVTHAADTQYFNGQTNVQFPEISELYHGYYASFVVSGDPNKYAVKGAPAWDRYYGVGGAQLAVGNEERGGVVMEEERVGIRLDECAWWRDEQRMLRLYK